MDNYLLLLMMTKRVIKPQGEISFYEGDSLSFAQWQKEKNTNG